MFRDVKGTQKRERTLGLHPNEKDLESQVWQNVLGGVLGWVLGKHKSKANMVSSHFPPTHLMWASSSLTVSGFRQKRLEGGAVPGGSLDGVAFWVFNL